MKMKKILSAFLALLMLCTLLTACGGSSKSAAMEYAVREEAAEAPMAMDMNASLTMGSPGAGETGSTALPESRKWIITVHLTAETNDLDAMTEALDQHIRSLNGYVEDQNIYNGSTYSNRRYRNANLTIRVPAEDVDRFTEEIDGIANVVRKEKNLEDVTLNYVSTESRMKALQTEEARLLDFMEQAETMADLLEIEARLTDVRYELERVTSQLRLYDNQIDYATIYLSIEEVQEYTPVEEPTFLERITEGFSNSLEGLWEGFVDFIVWIVANSPYLVVYGILITLILLLTKRVRKLNIRKKGKKHNEEQK
ncbi:MAG: DUF4349 domain-containing protein [Oscillospiraceae bacterium]|nr:DUF4349 domain-containing protein [Oscillospiraceae bacterium]